MDFPLSSKWVVSFHLKSCESLLEANIYMRDQVNGIEGRDSFCQTLQFELNLQDAHGTENLLLEIVLWLPHSYTQTSANKVAHLQEHTK